MKISIVIPVLHESERIPVLLEHLNAIRGGHAIQVIVVDGDPEGDTIRNISDPGVLTVIGPRGRGSQMNCGGSLAEGEVVLFLHADTYLPPTAFDRIADLMEHGDCRAGAFSLGFDSDHPAMGFIAVMANARNRLTRVPFGDQGHFFRRAFFSSIGGYAEIPLMEDAEIMHRIKKMRVAVEIIDDPVKTSARKWHHDGIIYTTLRNWLIQLLYACGASPEKLVSLYYGER